MCLDAVDTPLVARLFPSPLFSIAMSPVSLPPQLRSCRCGGFAALVGVVLLFAVDAPASIGCASSLSNAPSLVTDSLHLRLAYPSPVDAGTAVPFTFTVTNTSDAPTTLELTGRDISFDVRISSPPDSLVWNRLFGRVAHAILRLETLAPGDTLTLETTWPQTTNAGAPVKPGSYVVQARLPLVDAPDLVTDPDTIRIVPQ